MVKVVILCGGQGHRLKPLTKEIPKPMVMLNGKPILQYILEHYIQNGFREFILCTGFRSEVIHNFVRLGNFDADIKLSDAGEEAGILKRIHAAQDSIRERAIVTYGDTFIHLNPNEILHAHNQSHKDVTIMVADIRSPFGLVEFNHDYGVTFFKEKPAFSYYIGHFVIEKKVLETLDEGLIAMPDGSGIVELFQRLIRAKRLNAYRHEGFRITFNTAKERDRAEQEFINFFTEQEGEG